MKPSDWEDLALFSSVARAGGLKAAARESGTSEATLSRRMRAFEARLGRRLFQHGGDGYALTAEGRALFARSAEMDRAAADIGLWLAEGQGPVPVRISAGTWTALDLAQNIAEVWQPDAPWVPEFVQADERLDLARREIDIGIRNAAPTQNWLAGRRVGRLDFAAFAAHPGVTGWIAPGPGALTPSGRWILQHHSAQVVTRANTPQIAAALAQAGVGRVVLPVFAARHVRGLEPVSDPIADLACDEWLVSHHEGRNDAPVRAALDALAAYLQRRPARL